MPSKNKDYTKVLFRLTYILNKLETGAKITAAEFAEEFNVSLRTIQRDFERLNSSGFLLSSPEKGMHTFEKGISLKKMQVTIEEASLLSFFHEMSKSLGSRFEKSFQGLMHKILLPEYDSPYYVKIPEGVKLKEDYPFVRDLEGAIDESHKITLNYQAFDKEKVFKLHPLKIIFYDGFWYLLAQVDGKGWMLKLRLDRIKAVEVLEEYFVEPENLKAILDNSVNIWFSEKRDKKITLKIDKEVAHFFKQKKYFPLQKIKKENKDGSLVVECMACQYEEVINTIKHWIPHITVENPMELKAEIKKIVSEYLRKLK